ncbi:MAG: hypothetical protein WDZ62_02190 [Candidatus Pacearchaeota archaeon]
MKRKLLICWPINRHIAAKFSDLFENEFEEISLEEVHEIKEKFGFFKNRNLKDEDLEKENIVIESANFILFEGDVEEGFAKEFPYENADNIDHEFERIPSKLKKDILKYVNKIKPKKSIMQEINKFSEKNKIDNCYGVHIRRGDFSSMLDGRHKVSRDDLFIKEIKSIIVEDSQAKFFISTDSLKTEQKMKKVFGERIISFLKKGEGRKGILEAQEALIDLYLLSQTKHLLLSYGTSFSEFSWWLGGCKGKVKVVGMAHEKSRVRENIKKNKSQNRIIFKIKKKFNALIRRISGRSI